MVAPSRTRRGQTGQHSLAIVLDRRGLAVHGVRVGANGDAEGDGDALVAEADAEHGNVAAEGADRGR